MLFELIKGLIKDLDGASVDEVRMRNCYCNRNIDVSNKDLNIMSSLMT